MGVDERNNMRSSLVFIAALAAFTVAHEDSWDQVTEVQSSDAVLYKVQGNECGQVTIDAEYASEAEKFAGLKEGTGSSAGFTVADGTKSIKVPVIGNVNVSKFKKASLMANPAISCLKSKCSSQYSSCQGDSVCKSVMSCVEPCSDSSCALKCVKPHILDPKVASLGACGGKNGCWSSTAEETFPMAVPSGTYKGTTKELGVTVKATITIDDTSHADIAVVASGIVSVNVNCKKEAYQLASSGKVSLPGQGKSGDCIHDSLQKYSVDLKSVQYDSSSDSIELSVHKIVSIKVKLSKNSLSMEYVPESSQALSEIPPPGRPGRPGRPPLPPADGKTVQLSWQDCSGGKMHVKNVDVKFNGGKPVTLGQTLNVAASGNLDEAVTGGEYTFSAKAGIIPVAKHTDTVCGKTSFKVIGLGTVTVDGVDCKNTKPGTVKIGIAMKLPGSAPDIGLDIKVQGADQSKAGLFCVDVKAKIVGTESSQAPSEIASVVPLELPYVH